MFIFGLIMLQAEDAFKVNGKLKLYNIGTYKQSGDINTLDSNGLAVGGHLGVTSKKFFGWFSKVNLMTTQGLFVDNDPSQIDASVLARDVSTVSGNAFDKGDSITIVGEAYIGFSHEGTKLKVGRQIYNSPLAAAKVVRMLPSTFSGASAEKKWGDFSLGLAYFDKFKQRTSDKFYNILEHALGSKTKSLTNDTKGELLTAKLIYKKGKNKLSLHEYYIEDFIYAFYGDYTRKMGTASFALQALYQKSSGYFTQALENGLVNGTNYSEGMLASAVGAKVSFGSKENKFIIATTYTGSTEGAYSDVIAPFDGTPLFTDTITGNNLFKSLYGKALAADSSYVADTLSFKTAYKHKINQKVKSMISIGRFDQSIGGVAQTDINAVLSWKAYGWDMAAKAIYVFDNAQIAGNKLQQYRLILTYNFYK